MRQGVYITKITGNVLTTTDEKTSQINKDLKLGVNLRCEVITEESSYAYVTDSPSPESKREGCSVCLFPKTKVIVYTGWGFIKKIEIIKGLVFGQTSKVVTPTAEFHGSAWVDVALDGKTVVANSRDTIYHRKTRRAYTLDVNQQILATDDNIGEPEPMDQRFYQAEKIRENFGAFSAPEIYQRVAEQSDAFFEAYLTVLKETARKTGQDFEKLKEEARQTFLKQRQWAQTESEKWHQEAEKILKTDLNSSASVLSIDQTVKYQDLTLKIIKVKREPKQEGTDLLSIHIEAKNDSPKQIFVFWNEESRLINEKGENFLADDYNLETSYEAGAQAKGYLFIAVPKQDQRFIFQLGKASLAKVEVEINLSESQGGR